MLIWCLIYVDIDSLGNVCLLNLEVPDLYLINVHITCCDSASIDKRAVLYSVTLLTVYPDTQLYTNPGFVSRRIRVASVRMYYVVHTRIDSNMAKPKL